MAAFGAAPAVAAGRAARTEVVVALSPPGLARAFHDSRVLSARTRTQRLDLRSAMSTAYLADLTRRQDALARTIERVIPSARIRWHYQVVLDAIAVDLPADRLSQLSRLPGVAAVYPDVRYRASLDRSPELIGADQLWGLPDFTTAGQGVKIGIVDEGIDQAHPFFDPAGYSYPPGFPKGDTAFTTPKVIVARAFAPPGETWKYARVPFDPVYSDHATHVAGIAAGDYTVNAVPGRGPLSGVAPRAYLGNYKALTVPTQEFGLDGNAPEIAAAIEAAVRDGMDVINLSLGEPEIEPSRDLVVAAIDGAAEAGVVPTIAAGNEYEDFGPGSVSSPGTAPEAITVAAVTKSDLVAPFSSGGPTPISLGFKPDLSAPGVSILSAVPPREGSWAVFSGTSMAAPHAAGAAALLRQRHPDWTVAQIKSALVSTGDPVFADERRVEVPATREGGGLIDLPKANDPLVFTTPADLSFGLLRAGQSASRTVQVSDAGGGAGSWDVFVDLQGQPAGVQVTAAPTPLTVPGSLTVQTTSTATAAETDVTGFVVLRRGDDVRRIPFWFRVERPRLGKPSGLLTKPGLYQGDTRKGQARVSSYRYPAAPAAPGVGNDLRGPEQVFRVRLRRRVANFGVVVVRQGRGVQVTPRIVEAGDENRLVGVTAIPIDDNPYLTSFGRPQPIAAAIAPGVRDYDVVFDTRGRSSAGPFTFRFWVDDTSPPSAHLLTPTVAPGGNVVVRLTDAGSGVDSSSIAVSVDGKPRRASYSSSQAAVSVRGLARGRHSLVLSASDYQEEKNMESYGTILPNTRVLRAAFTVG
ncbi:MAG TPA: S8 family serine peptidase [Gaiellaceae bacterium]|nr:S8 family serine peptidase [Gaiellaceae bacterium]